MFSGRVADKFIFVALYLAAAVPVVWGCSRLMDYAQDAELYRDYLMPWETRLLAMRFKTVQWPDFSGDNPVGYMQEVVKLMQANGLQPPESNAVYAFMYRLKRFGGQQHALLLVFLDNRIVIYGLPRATFDQLDRFIDGRADPDAGNFTGQWSTDRLTRIGYWRI